MSQPSNSCLLLRRAALLAACGWPALVLPAQATSTSRLGFPALVQTAAADVTVAGRVTQSNGDGLPGVTVVVKGTTRGTTRGTARRTERAAGTCEAGRTGRAERWPAIGTARTGAERSAGKARGGTGPEGCRRWG